jgi:hypothetical protein
MEDWLKCKGRTKRRFLSVLACESEESSPLKSAYGAWSLLAAIVITAGLSAEPSEIWTVASPSGTVAGIRTLI